MAPGFLPICRTAAPSYDSSSQKCQGNGKGPGLKAVKFALLQGAEFRGLKRPAASGMLDLKL